MSIYDLLMISVSLAMDAFAVSMCKGLSVQNATLKQSVVTGLYFGGFQGLMPFIGFLLGYKFKNIISAFDYIVSFVLLSIIGLNMIKEALWGEDEVCDCCFGAKAMLPLAVATSIDALAVGITFVGKNSFTGPISENIFATVATIGIITFVLSAIGVKIGNLFGIKYKKKAELAGGIVLVLMGIKMFVAHF